MGAVVVLDLSDITSNGEQTIVRPNTVNILWQIPQYVIISAGEILFGISGLEFSYSEAAPNMKSVLQAMWLMTTFFGNLIDAAISGTKIVADPAAEFFLYASMMFAVMIIFIIMAMRYKSVDKKEFDELPAEKPEIDD
uniref:Peptide MFS transporter n=2 Tax=Bursaphelenchus xylophilus TaxID=6326 RepID=A0A1I7RTF6_BURXY